MRWTEKTAFSLSHLEDLFPNFFILWEFFDIIDSEHVMPKNSVRSSDDERLNTKLLLQTLAAVKKGDFTLRLPSSWSGIDGKIADTLNEIIEMMSDSTKEMERVSRAVGREGKLSQRVASAAARGSWKSRVDAVNDLIENLVRPTAEMARVIGSVAKGNLTETVALEAEGQPLRGEFLSTAKMVNAMLRAPIC